MSQRPRVADLMLLFERQQEQINTLQNAVKQLADDDWRPELAALETRLLERFDAFDRPPYRAAQFHQEDVEETGFFEKPMTQRLLVFGVILGLGILAKHFGLPAPNPEFPGLESYSS